MTRVDLDGPLPLPTPQRHPAGLWFKAYPSLVLMKAGYCNLGPVMSSHTPERLEKEGELVAFSVIGVATLYRMELAWILAMAHTRTAPLEVLQTDKAAVAFRLNVLLRGLASPEFHFAKQPGYHHALVRYRQYAKELGCC